MDGITSVTVDDFRKGMQCLASGVCIIATGRDDQRTGFTATAVMSLSDAPPCLAVGVGKNNRSHDLIRSSGRFSVNVLRSDQQDLADVFSGRAGISGESRFDFGHWGNSALDLPHLHSALAVFECELMQEMSVSTHTLIIGRIMLIEFPCSANPLVYWRKDYQGLCQLLPQNLESVGSNGKYWANITMSE